MVLRLPIPSEHQARGIAEERSGMMHFTCDLCGKDMAADDPDRQIVRIDVRPANPHWKLTEDDLEQDNLDQVSALIQHAEASGSEFAATDAPIVRRLDMCCECREKFLADPFQRKAAVKLNFSQN